MNGVINIDKPLGFTSSDVVCVMRRILSTKKVGHTGTLDPDAGGVLPICVGRATKLSDMLTAQEKQYTAEVTLGSATDTLDSSGTVTETADVNVTEAEIREAVGEFIGDIEQIPPMYSAIKVDGKKLCDLARAGKTAERKPRSVRIESIEILSLDLEHNKFSMKVNCSKGTYIRTLCDDIGRRLRCFAHMSALTRTRSGRFGIENSYTPERVEQMIADGDMSFLMSLDEVLSDYPKLVISNRKASRVRCGQQVSAQGAEEGKIYRVYDESGNFLTVSELNGGTLKILKTFYQITDTEGGKNDSISE